MAYLNKVMLIGNLGKDPAINVSPNGRKRVSFSLATSRRYKDNRGEQKEQTDWHNIVGWGKIADTIETLGIKKGITLYVEGTLTNREYTDQATGAKRYMTEVSLDNFQVLTPRNAGTQGGATSQGANSYGSGANNPYSRNNAPSNANPYAGTQDDNQMAEEEDLPF